MSKLAGIYIHIPFCATRCHYCNFATGGYESGLARRYTDAVREDAGRVVAVRDDMADDRHVAVAAIAAVAAALPESKSDAGLDRRYGGPRRL